MSQWMARAVRNAGLQGADSLDLPPGLDIEEIWDRTATACGLAPTELAAAIAKAFAMNVANMEHAVPTATKLLPASIARKFGVYPLCDQDRYLLVATSNPVDANADQEIGFASGRLARFELAPPSVIEERISRTYEPDDSTASMMAQLDQRFRAERDVEVSIAEDEAPEEVSAAEVAAGPIVRLANIILHEAVKRGASDVHIQPLSGEGVVRFRVDGVLHNGMHIPLPVMTRVVSRIKIMAKLDITDRLRPQDGRAGIHVVGRKYDLRVSTVPTRKAEKAVIRILDPQGAGTLNETGIVPAELERIRQALKHRDGIVVVTGPTGSGKTTTMYGALQEIATEDINIMTVEDPVEYELPRLTQIQVEHKQGMTFASALRAILRQDPDVIFVGEIRDSETAEIAAQASLTGHLVLATLHTNDAIGSIRRFMDLGLDESTLAETLRGALAQRLVRKLCPDCSEEVGTDLTASEEELANRFGQPPVRRAVGCDHCMGSGYRGRLPLTEFMTMTPALSGMMITGAPPHEMQRQAVADGMTTLLQAGLQRVVAGETTLEEVERVVGSGDVPQDSPTAEPAVSAELESTQAAMSAEAEPTQAALSSELESTQAALSAEAEPTQAAATPAPAHPEPDHSSATADPEVEPLLVDAGFVITAFDADIAGFDEATKPDSDRPGGGGYAPAPGYEVPGPAGSAYPVAPGTTLDGGLTHVPGPIDLEMTRVPTSALSAPATEAHARPGPAAVVETAPADGPDSESTKQRPHVLLVDDDGTTRSIARALIEKHLGYEVSESKDGSEALLRFARGEEFSLMVLDLDMPILGGREVLRWVRQSTATAKLPVIVLTGAPDPGTEIELMEMGADDYLRKPLDAARLEARIKAALRRAEG